MSCEELRVRVSEFGSLSGDSPLLAPVPTAPGHPQQYLHRCVVPALLAMSAAAEAFLGFPLLVASGRRPHRWTSRARYEQVLVDKYTQAAQKHLGRAPSRVEVVAYGRLYLAFDSPHETALVCDFECGGLAPVSATIAQQLKTPVHRWLVENAWRWGWHPYLVEPWHWERWIPIDAYKSGEVAWVAGRVPLSSATVDSAPNDVCEDNMCLEGPVDPHG